jgi:hypothetical protein
MTEQKTAGYKRPPKAHQFQKGQSGNSLGRPKGTRNLRTDLAALMKKPVSIRENGKQHRISRQEAMLLSLYDKALHGDVKAAVSIVQLIMKLEPSSTGPSNSDAVSQTDQAIIDDFLRRHTAGSSSGDGS